MWEYIVCPICGKTLINLSLDDYYVDYWCDSCGYELRLDEDGYDITEEV